MQYDFLGLWCPSAVYGSSGERNSIDQGPGAGSGLGWGEEKVV